MQLFHGILWLAGKLTQGILMGLWRVLSLASLLVDDPAPLEEPPQDNGLELYQKQIDALHPDNWLFLGVNQPARIRTYAGEKPRCRSPNLECGQENAQIPKSDVPCSKANISSCQGQNHASFESMEARLLSLFGCFLKEICSRRQIMLAVQAHSACHILPHQALVS